MAIILSGAFKTREALIDIKSKMEYLYWYNSGCGDNDLQKIITKVHYEIDCAITQLNRLQINEIKGQFTEGWERAPDDYNVPYRT